MKPEHTTHLPEEQQPCQSEEITQTEESFSPEDSVAPEEDAQPSNVADDAQEVPAEEPAEKDEEPTDQLEDVAEKDEAVEAEPASEAAEPAAEHVDAEPVEAETVVDAAEAVDAEPEPATAETPQAPSRRNWKFAAVVLLCLLAIWGVSATSAFFKAQETANNVLTFGAVKMQVNGIEDNKSEKATSGTAEREVTFTNVGSVDMFVRARPVIKPVKGDGTAGKPIENNVTIDLGAASTHWTVKDGWYYYNAEVKVDETTEPLMTGVTFSGDFYDLVGPGGEFVLTVEAEAVQVDHQGEGVTALTAVGWPSESAGSAEGDQNNG